MPLPRSLTCSSCQHTYPEGWKRCPYCGFDPEKQKRDRQIERALVKRFPSYAAAVKSEGGQGGGQKRRQQSRRERGQDRPPRSGDPNRIPAAGEAVDVDRKRSRRRRGRRRRGGGGSAEALSGAQDNSRGRSNEQKSPPRETRPSNGSRQPTERPPGDGAAQQARGPGGEGGEQTRSRRRRPRRRRRPQGAGGPDKKSDS